MRGLLGEIVKKTATERQIVVDMEAGVEHLSRGTVRHVGRMLVVVEPYFRSIETGGRTAELARELGIPRVEVVANKIRDAVDRQAILDYCDSRDLPVVAEIPYDEGLRDAERSGAAPLDHDAEMPAVRAIAGLVE